MMHCPISHTFKCKNAASIV